ncbi:MAG: hypothetical protein ACK4SY_00500 [Pyrobaculum sp.]
MWAVAYGVIALALTSLVAILAVVHSPQVAFINTAEELYLAKAKFRDLHLLNKTDDINVFRSGFNITLVKPLSAGSPQAGGNVPVGYRLRGEGRYVTYQLHLEVVRCIEALKPSGEPAVLYEISLVHSVDFLPWLETLAYVGGQAGGELVRTEHALVYHNGTSTLYVLAPRDAAFIYIVDYPIYLPVGCP